MAKKKYKPRVERLASAKVTSERSVGQPLKSDGPVYREHFKAMVIEMGIAGWSDAMIAMELGVTRKSVWYWEKTKPDFAEAMSYARDCARAWWERKGQRSLNRTGFNTALYNKIIACRYRDEYSDRFVHAGDGDNPVHTVTEIKRTVVRPAT